MTRFQLYPYLHILEIERHNKRHRNLNFVLFFIFLIIVCTVIKTNTAFPEFTFRESAIMTEVFSEIPVSRKHSNTFIFYNIHEQS